MKKSFIFLLIICVSFILSCKKDVPGQTEEYYYFNVALPDTLITTKEKAHFLLYCNPDVISFYPGDSSHNYDYRDRTYAEGGKIKFKFNAKVTTTADTIDVMVSTDYSGNNDSASIVNAHWKKLSSLFVFPSGSTLSVTNDSTDITDSTILGQPFYLAFKYINQKPKNITWTINNVGLFNVFGNGTAPSTMIKLTNIRSGGYSPVSINSPKKLLWKIPTSSSGSLTLANSTSSGGYPIGTEAWLVSGIQKASVNPDQPIIIKNITQSPVESYDYQYTKPGTYKATFVASYTRLNYERTFIKQITVIVQ